jgi:DNA helicase-2/ATP-dependent DNA helicase PcrA
MELTGQQRGVVDDEGDFLLIACPGSGKTRSAAARVGAVASRDSKVAICSYTNVGADRIGSVIAEMGIVLGPEHFVGTLHGFLLRYVVYPFGAVVGAERGPHLIEGSSHTVPYRGDNKKRVEVDAFRMRPDGSLKLKNRPQYLSAVPHEDIVADVESEVRRHKRVLLRAGFVSFDDAMFVALSILRQQPEIARAVAGRFDEVLLDEAQDTSELQLACLDALKATGALRSLVLVGDLEQSIFAFQGASADGCRRLAEKHGLRTIELTQNHRCSQLICDVAVHFCERDKPDEAVGATADCPIEPEVMLYPAADPPAAVELFRQRLAEHGGDPTTAAILARSNALVAELNGDEPPVPVSDRPIRLGRAVAALRHGTLTRRQLEQVERIVAYAAWDEEVLDRLDPEQCEHLRTEAVGLLQNLPSLDEDLRVWIQRAAALVGEAAGRLADPPANPGGRVVRSKAEHTGTVARDAFVSPRRELGAQTVHDIKGEDRDAVMVVIDRPRSRTHAAQVTLWESALTGEEIEAEQAEEKRIAFVALTRAERICVVALPDDVRGRAAAEAFAMQGFRRVA